MYIWDVICENLPHGGANSVLNQLLSQVFDNIHGWNCTGCNKNVCCRCSWVTHIKGPDQTPHMMLFYLDQCLQYLFLYKPGFLRCHHISLCMLSKKNVFQTLKKISFYQIFFADNIFFYLFLFPSIEKIVVSTQLFCW